MKNKKALKKNDATWHGNLDRVVEMIQTLTGLEVSRGRDVPGRAMYLRLDHLQTPT